MIYYLDMIAAESVLSQRPLCKTIVSLRTVYSYFAGNGIFDSCISVGHGETVNKHIRTATERRPLSLAAKSAPSAPCTALRLRLPRRVPC